MPIKVAAIVLAVCALSGCWNGENVHISLGDVSLGQQLMDLQTALEADAISEEEYAATKKSLLAMAIGCDEAEEEDDSDSVWF